MESHSTHDSKETTPIEMFRFYFSFLKKKNCGCIIESTVKQRLTFLKKKKGDEGGTIYDRGTVGGRGCKKALPTVVPTPFN